MLGIASRYFAGRIAVAAAAAIILGIVTGLDETGHVVMFGTIVLGTAAAAFALLTALALSLGDNDSIDRERSHSYPATPAYWPVMSAFGLGLLMVGLTTDGFIAILGPRNYHYRFGRMDRERLGRPAFQRSGCKRY